MSVTRSEAPPNRVPYATSVLGRDAFRRGRQTLGLDEALNDLPGVVVENRYNYSLDQRISIRGFGARSNFGVRGLKILLDGVPQTLPDGQSQLTNVEFGALGRAEVLRGSSSSLYGNASGGVISLASEQAAAAPIAQRVRVQGGTGTTGNDDFYKWQSWTSARRDNVSGTLSLSQFKTDGFRQHSSAEIRQLNAGVDWQPTGATALTVRLSAADNPQAQNPGALTFAEYAANADSAAGNNIRRDADKDVQQQQLSIGVRHFDGGGNEYAVTAFGLLRDLKNPLAAPPAGGAAGPTVGTYVGIDRAVGGLRATATRRFGSSPSLPVLTFGADVQRMRDNRDNRVAFAGVASDSVVLDQRELITEVGPFAQLQWTPDHRFLASGGARYDRVRFDVADRHLSDGVDNSGARTMSALSAQVGISYQVGEPFIPYVNVSTSFETPTTTELVNQPGSTGGFNTELDPQRAVNYEVGARGRVSHRLTYSAAFFLGRVRDAIVQVEEVGGRAFFRNAGRTHNDGAEFGLSLSPVPAVTLIGSYTYAHYRFADYKVVSGETVDTLDGNRLPGVPEHFWRIGLRGGLPYGFYVDGDHTISTSVAANDANTLFADAWGAGVTNLRLGWDGPVGAVQIAPFIGINNLWDRRYVASVTLNGAGGRVFEPAPRRILYIGTEIGYRTGAEHGSASASQQ